MDLVRPTTTTAVRDCNNNNTRGRTARREDERTRAHTGALHDLLQLVDYYYYYTTTTSLSFSIEKKDKKKTLYISELVPSHARSNNRHVTRGNLGSGTVLSRVEDRDPYPYPAIPGPIPGRVIRTPANH